jgi:DNA invertase Pin-like site-specific DNA recombinase
MTTYGYIRNSRSLESGHAKIAPEAQCQQLLRAGVDPLHIYSDVSSFRTKGARSRNQWRVLNQTLALGDVLVVLAIDRISAVT